MSSNTRKVSVDLETRPLMMDEMKSFDKGGLFDLGHPLLNRIAHSFIKAAGIGAVQAVSREAYFTVVEGAGLDSGSTDASGAKRRSGFPDFGGETGGKSVEALVKNTGKESFQWGLAAGVYSGLTYGLKEARGHHDWKNSAVAGALTGMAVALTSDATTHEQVVQSAITGAAIAAAANMLSNVF
ncbi:outer envelope pore protein 16-2, chloroplastic [Silene latifolia]|uniref:outer envelope pore protein 16-2, chloroplastic n=1 Tax=Silene latifolia TaxID=37657 RepID=UPI003D777C5C